MRLLLLLTFLSTIVSSNLYGQTDKDPLKNTNSHEHGKNEIGIAISPAYFIKEKVWTVSMHIHYVRIIPNTKFGIGASFERIVLDPKHSTFGMVFAYYPVEKLSFTLSPGITFEDANPGAFFAFHVETAYEFEIGDFHIGPAFEFAYDPNDYHISLGVHVGYGF
ncbi:MAG: hypothetical protein L3J34_07045 [Flavobacteriaceae bacterium]|nr:hypothetical protein [Flavobacteriaceae bacterium]